MGMGPDFPSAENYLFELFHSRGWNPAHAKDPLLDQLIEQSRRAFDLSERVHIYEEICDLTTRDYLYAWLCQPERTDVLRDWVRGYYYNPILGPKYHYIRKAAS